MAALLLPLLVFSVVQSASNNVIGVDGYYHIKVASLIREAGLSGPRIEFPWLRFTILNEAAYTDHHLLFHILQSPFTVLDLRLAAKLSAVFFATLGFWGCYLFMARTGVRRPIVWLILLLAVGHTFLWRHSMARPQSLALLLLIAALWMIFEPRQQRWLVAVGFVSAWLFDGFVLTLAIPAAAMISRLSLDRRLEWQPLFYLVLGIGLGMLIHPYFPRNVVFAALHLLPKSGLVGQDEVRVGTEWYPYSRAGFLTRIGPSLAVMALGLVPILHRLWRQERPHFQSLTLTLLGLGFLALQVRSQRLVEYFPAFAVLLTAFSWSRERPCLPPRLRQVAARWQSWLVPLGGILLAGWLIWTVSLARRDTTMAPANARIESYREAAAWLVENSPRGSLVFNTDWDDFPQLFFWNTHNVYVVGLDATYMSIYDPELYRAWRSVATGLSPTPSLLLGERFGAQHVFSDTQHSRFLSLAMEDPGLEEVFRSPAAVVFRIRQDDRPAVQRETGKLGITRDMS